MLRSGFRPRTEPVTSGHQGHHKIQRWHEIHHDELGVHRAQHPFDLLPKAFADFRMTKHQRLAPDWHGHDAFAHLVGLCKPRVMQVTV